MILLLACAKPLPDLGAIPAFSLVDQSGAPQTDALFHDRVSIVDFMFTSCPDICPTLSARMSALQEHYKGDSRVGFVSISVDPKTDTPPVLTTYSQRFAADATRWHFLTGDADAVKKVVVDGFKTVMNTDTPDGNVLHGSRFVVVDGAGHIRAYPDPKTPGEVEAAVDSTLALR